MLKKQSFVDAEQIFLLGASQGGVVSAITAAEHTDEIRGLILLYPAFVLIDDAKERFARVDEIPEKYFHMWMTVGKTYFENLSVAAGKLSGSGNVHPSGKSVSLSGVNLNEKGVSGCA